RPAGARDASTPLASYVPRQDLFLYLELDGLNAHADAWHASAAYKLLNDTKLGALLEDFIGQGVDLAQQSVPVEKRVKPAEVIGLIKHGAHRGLVLGAWGKAPNQVSLVIVARRADRPEVHRLLEAAAAANLGQRDEGEAKVAPIQKAGRTLHPLDKDG